MAETQNRTALEIVEEINQLDSDRLALEGELILLTGKTHAEFVAGMAALLEPTDGYPPHSTGAHHLQAWREQFGGGL